MTEVFQDRIGFQQLCGKHIAQEKCCNSPRFLPTSQALYCGATFCSAWEMSCSGLSAWPLWVSCLGCFKSTQLGFITDICIIQYCANYFNPPFILLKLLALTPKWNDCMAMAWLQGLAKITAFVDNLPFAVCPWAGWPKSSGVDRCLPDGSYGGGLPCGPGPGSLPGRGRDDCVGVCSKRTQAGCVWVRLTISAPPSSC